MSSPESHYLQLIIPSEKEDSRLIGRAVYSFCLHMGFDEVQSYQIELATVEVTHNIVGHAYDNCPDCVIELHAQGLADRIIFTIIDNGKSADAFAFPACCPVDPGSAIDRLPESSMGLYIIASVMDTVEYEVYENSNILTMMKYLPKS
ncbi:anti-sigma regulatory factor (Ser/Thr protein kinase) [Desulfocapsa sulfexigens DSM 10523]|uniref:Anti-sigma regulatory factor (Ser/Thr protein kinase) n=1 Tax=Desulfocapsa sulfexigens (strain DSM 10523 / SB164P1) TaxID=1167006 RepID=M1PNA6_DESSD|nr:ATP-binding protein [Desulfocapsa sulfexigens]AGF77916.1 anti-sigma regulatory factor (Ser/Thr protein kinase) [Desulfocapsa sulfexigens DSM 10523]